MRHIDKGRTARAVHKKTFYLQPLALCHTQGLCQLSHASWTMGSSWRNLSAVICRLCYYLYPVLNALPIAELSPSWHSADLVPGNMLEGGGCTRSPAQSDICMACMLNMCDLHTQMCAKIDKRAICMSDQLLKAEQGCPNRQAGSQVLSECYSLSGHSNVWQKWLHVAFIATAQKQTPELASRTGGPEGPVAAKSSAPTCFPSHAGGWQGARHSP